MRIFRLAVSPRAVNGGFILVIDYARMQVTLVGSSWVKGLPQQRVGQRPLWPEIVTSARPKRQAGVPKARPAGETFWSIQYARGRRHSRRHPLPARRFFSRALELLAHGKTDTVKGARNSGLLHGTWSKGTVPTSQLASLVRKRVGRRG